VEKSKSDLWELALSGNTRVVFTRTLAGVLYCEVQRPVQGEKDWLTIDSIFLEQEQIDELRDLLRPQPQTRKK
jgi:hypothetical protein